MEAERNLALEGFALEMIKRIEQLIKEKGYTKKAFAKKIGKTPGWLNNKLKEHRQITMNDLYVMARGLDLEPGDLFPAKLRYDISQIPLTELVKRICENEVQKYLEHECIYLKDKNNNGGES